MFFYEIATNTERNES